MRCWYCSADCTLSGPGQGDTFFERLESWYQQERISEREHDAGPDADIPFCGGWFLYLGYEAAAEIEPTLKLPANRTGLPDAIAHRCRGALIVIHDPETPARSQAVAVAETEALLSEMMRCLDTGSDSNHRTAETSPGALDSLQEEDPQRFEQSVGRIHDYLLAGDVFQVNISRLWTAPSGTRQTPVLCTVHYAKPIRRPLPACCAGRTASC